MNNRKKIYTALLRQLERGEKEKANLIKDAQALVFGRAAANDVNFGDETRERGEIGAVLNEMILDGVVIISKDGTCRAAVNTPVALRIESCARKILSLLESKPMDRQQIRNELEKYFGTYKTPTQRDDSILFTYIGKVLKRLENQGVIELYEGVYRICEKKKALVSEIDKALELRGDFLSRLHSKGGEFFEHYFMTLLGKYLSKHGKTVIECKRTGGTNDGGIDGVVKTEDSLGFREYIIVQTKNRYEVVNETAIRGFYGVVCAANGSRGIFATTSEFHYGALNFINAIDNCIGIDGDRIFKMAVECLYGIKRRDGKYLVDDKIL